MLLILADGDANSAPHILPAKKGPASLGYIDAGAKNASIRKVADTLAIVSNPYWESILSNLPGACSAYTNSTHTLMFE